MAHHSLLTLTFHDGLTDLLKKGFRHGAVAYALRRRASIKDIIESLGIPHTEVGRITVKGLNIGFDYIPCGDTAIYIYPMTADVVGSLPSVLWQEPWSFTAFMVDVNVLKLARNLRICGFDTTIVPDSDPVEAGIFAFEQKRVLLSRSRQLLKCSTIEYGQLLRSQNHIDQLKEVMSRFSLSTRIKPFSRCLTCNGLLEDVAKQCIEHLLEPLTRKYYHKFKRCRHCQSIYWHGSHTPHIQSILDEIAMMEVNR